MKLRTGNSPIRPYLLTAVLSLALVGGLHSAPPPGADNLRAVTPDTILALQRRGASVSEITSLLESLDPATLQPLTDEDLAALERADVPGEVIAAYLARQEEPPEPGITASAGGRRHAVRRPSVPEASAVIGPEGGQVVVDDPTSSLNGVALTVAPGSMEDPVEIQVLGSRDDSTENAPALIELKPSGLEFSTPATLSIPYDSSSIDEPAIFEAFSFSQSNPLRLGESENSQWERLQSTVASDRVDIAVPHFSSVAASFSWLTGSWDLPLYVVLHLPGKYLKEGDLIYALALLRGDPSNAFTWFPGHAAMYLGTDTATDDLTINDGERIIESVPNSVQTSKLTAFRDCDCHIYMGARRYIGDLTPANRKTIAAYALAQKGKPYSLVGEGNWRTTKFSCVGLTEAAYDSARRSIIPSYLETPFALPVQQFARTEPVSEITIDAGVPLLDIPVNGVVKDESTGYYKETSATVGSSLRSDLGMSFSGGIFRWPNPTAGTYSLDFYTSATIKGRSVTTKQNLKITVLPPPAVGEELTVTLPGGVPLVMVKIPKGTFMMGSPTTERGRISYSETQHQVTLTQDYYLGKYEVTQQQWQAVMGTSPWISCGPSPGTYGIGDNYPVYCVSWNMIAGSGGFIEKLNQYTLTTKFRLPTDAEWERGARAGTTTRFSYGDVLECDDDCGSCPTHDQYIWWCGNSGSTSHPVGQKLPNGYGLYDMHGNLVEWVQDWFSVLSAGAVTDPTGPGSSTGSGRVVRDGSFGGANWLCRSAHRNDWLPGTNNLGLGFRLARSE